MDNFVFLQGHKLDLPGIQRFSGRVSESPWQVPRLLVVLFALLQVGCDHREPTNTLPNPMDVSDAQGANDLQRGIEFLEHLDEFDPAQALEKARYHLQKWLEKQTPIDNWQVDPVITQIPGLVRDQVNEASLARLEIGANDALVLREIIWLRNIARMVCDSQAVPPHLESWLAGSDDGSRASQPLEVRQAALLFDWTVRNLQLDPAIKELQSNGTLSAVPLLPGENLLLGRGTMEEKARVFLLLARQMKLPVVMLAIFDEESQDQPRSWLPALVLNDQLLLFDMQLGMPVPGRDGIGIASLAEVVESPQLLAQLALQDHGYRISADDLQHVIAMVDAAPTYLSQRMQILENALVGDQKLVLTASPSLVMDQVRRCAHIEGVGLWALEVQTYSIRRMLQEKNSPAMMELTMEQSVFNPSFPLPLFTARALQFRGRLEDRDSRPGARSLYLGCRPPEAEIQRLAELPMQHQEQEGQPSPEQEQQHQQRIAGFQTLIRRAKQNATYWLGLVAYNNGDYEVAVDFLEKRLLAHMPDTVWRGGACYNLGRAYEAWGRQSDDDSLLQKAVIAYEALDAGPSRDACLLRAHRLRQELTVPSSSAENAAAAEADPDPSSAEPQTTEPQTTEPQTDA